MKSASEIKLLAQKIRVKRNVVNRDRILAGAQAALQKSKNAELAFFRPNRWSNTMKSRITITRTVKARGTYTTNCL